MKNKELGAVLQELKDAGIHDAMVARGGRHLQVRWRTTNGQRTYTVACSGSDWRGARNARSAVRRLLRGDGLLVEREPRPQSEPHAPVRDWQSEIERLERRVARLEARVGT